MYVTKCVCVCNPLRRLISRAEPPTFVAPPLLFEEMKPPTDTEFMYAEVVPSSLGIGGCYYVYGNPLCSYLHLFK